jgi:histidyl-tRNA synthetase
MELAPPRGTSDLLPPLSGAMRALYEAAARQAQLFGYGYVETPAFEATELFARTSGETSDVVRKEMYTFEDRGGRLVTLRPEATAGIVRAFLANSHGLPSPFKAYTIGPMWRYGRPQAGRLREFRQFDIEILGSGEPAADVEAAVVGERYLRGTGLGGLRLELNSMGDETCRPAYREELLAYLEKNRERLTDEHRDRFQENPLRVLDCKDASCRAVSAGAPKIVDHLCQPCREHFESVQHGLETESIAFDLVPTLVRGLDYYTRTTFEWVSPALSGGQGSVGGGGRYDGLAEVLGGPATPGVGFAIGLDRVLLALQHEGRQVQGEAGLDCYVVAIGDEAAGAAAAARALREAGLATTTSFESRALGGQMKAADRSGARFAVIVGPKEVASGTLTWRRLSDGSQHEGSIDEAIEIIRGGT